MGIWIFAISCLLYTSWWLWDGIYSKDGTPIGYQVFESGKNGIANYVKSVGHDRDYQFLYYPVCTVPGHEDELCVKVWNWDNRWKVEYYEELCIRDRY